MPPTDKPMLTQEQVAEFRRLAAVDGLSDTDGAAKGLNTIEAAMLLVKELGNCEYDVVVGHKAGCRRCKLLATYHGTGTEGQREGGGV